MDDHDTLCIALGNCHWIKETTRGLHHEITAALWLAMHAFPSLWSQADLTSADKWFTVEHLRCISALPLMFGKSIMRRHMGPSKLQDF